MLLTIGDLLEEILVRLDAAPVRGVVSSVRSARVRGGSAANVAAIDAEIEVHRALSARWATMRSGMPSSTTSLPAASTSGVLT